MVGLLSRVPATNTNGTAVEGYELPWPRITVAISQFESRQLRNGMK